MADTGKLEDNWSVASHKTIQPGDRAYIVRVGVEPKGIFASGIIASEPYLAFRKGRHYHRITIAIDVLLNPDKQQILTLDILKTGNLAAQTGHRRRRGSPSGPNWLMSWKVFGRIF
ncbi:hypothetical protein HK413_09465 [Mucilaginibacter sp. S1162]|uniref:Uncharacterized protein n=1 Tax=Mucilaginibacter humi TaxID=2732510 RepID=A0ABX1W383_9SPHI|nr:hypothetical protein [Mucilaginibacter humi]NNU34319.1 hypothetical protein [Mucilaginibacter humi]